MNREWKPGTVLVDNSGRVVFAIEVTANSIAAAKSGQAWEEGACIIEADGNGWHPSHFENLRPLVVIDPESEEDAESIVKAFVASGVWKVIPAEVENSHVHRREQVQAALREFANPTPPKPDEPQGLGAVVEDEHGNRWIRTDPEVPGWTEWNAPVTRTPYARIAAVRILSPGVTS